MSSEKKECIFTWNVENYSYWCLKYGEVLNSPEFIADNLNGTTWNLRLYPRGNTDNGRNNILLYLARCETCNGPENIQVRWQLSVLASDGSDIKSRKFVNRFEKGTSIGMTKFLQMNEDLVRRRAEFLPNDRLSLRCTIWSGERNTPSVERISAVTRIGVETITFIHVVEGFSKLKRNWRNNLIFKSPTGGLLLSIVYNGHSCCKGKIVVEFTSGCPNLILTKRKFSILDRFGNIISSSKVDCHSDGTGKDLEKLSLPLTRKVILNRKSEYLLDDKLYVHCFCGFSAGIELNKIESSSVCSEIPFLDINWISNSDLYNTRDAAKNLAARSSALNDFKTIYNDQLLSDVEIKTKTKSFSAHKMVLCARSTVFKSMLTSDMIEKDSSCIQVDDLENDTIQQLLLFLYSDKLDNLQWQSATKLFYAAVKYNIERLKVSCSSFLQDKLGMSNAAELLHLADTHNYLPLRKSVEDFILEHEEEVFGSVEWEKLMEVNPQLVCKTMHMKYIRKKGDIKE